MQAGAVAAKVTGVTGLSISKALIFILANVPLHCPAAEVERYELVNPIFKDPVTNKIARFLIEIGFDVRSEELPQKTFLPGVTVIQGEIVADESRLLSGGDLLHEAGHLALIAPAQRKLVNYDAGAGQELAATAWSYAAALHLGLDGSVVFHPKSFKEEGPHLLENFSQGRYYGVPSLQLRGMTADEKQAKVLGVPPYPHMLRWLREE